MNARQFGPTLCRLLALGAATAALAAGATPGIRSTAGGQTLDAPPLGVARTALPTLDLLAITRLDARPRSATRGAWWGGPIVTSTGETVNFYVSDNFPPTEANQTTRQSWANFFAWLYHGSELGTITIYQAPLFEVRDLCGNPNAGGCYSPSQHVLVFPGDVGAAIEADIGAHEYGHHVASSRRNDPWDANAWGPKRWASYVGVCARAGAGSAFPGDEADHYTLNPGEAFAETYKVLNQQRGGTWAYLPLVVDSSFTPDGGGFAAALGDVQQPWTTPTSTTWDEQFSQRVTPLTATVASNGAISLRTGSGGTARTLTSGIFSIAVRDSSTKDDFHLTGLGVSRKTGVRGTGSVVWRLRLPAGVYDYYSDSRPDVIRSFTVGEAPSVPDWLAPRERTLGTPLDGVLQIAVSGSSSPSVEVVAPATDQVLVSATRAPVSLTICGQRSVLLRVVPASAGTAHVAITTP
jgi:hypothetical protein